MTASMQHGWETLRHGGLLLDADRLRRIAEHTPAEIPWFHEEELRRRASKLLSNEEETGDFVTFVLETLCGFPREGQAWLRGSQVPAEFGRRTVTGTTSKPRQIWRGPRGAILPVFFDAEKRLGIGKGKRAVSDALQWLRAGTERLALLTNGRQWRLLFAGLDFDAWCESDLDLWFAEGALSDQFHALRTLLAPAHWTPPSPDAAAPLLQAILDSRKGQSELSASLGERVREAVELIVQGHGEVLKTRCADVAPAEIYRAAVRVVMRMVVVLFAESRELLPRDSALYHGSYGLSGLLEDLEKTAARGGNRLARATNAWPRVLALFQLVHQGSHHPALLVPAYGGELFESGDPKSEDGLRRALAVFETACFDQEQEVLTDRDVHRILERITRTWVKVRQGRSSTRVLMPVDFGDLSSEYIGILYEGLLDFELRTVPAGDPIIFLALGNEPALPLSRLEKMDAKAIKDLVDKLKQKVKGGDEEEETGEDAEDAEDEAEADDEQEGEAAEEGEEEPAPEAEVAELVDDARQSTRSRAEKWAREVVTVAGLAPKLRGRRTPEALRAHELVVGRKARQLVTRVVLPGEWFLVRWGGTRKGSGTFYTRPGLAVPTVQRTLRPLCYDAPKGPDGQPDLLAAPTDWAARLPEQILALKVCDPACGSGSFLVASLRFLTEALYVSLHKHGRIKMEGDRAIVDLLGIGKREHGGEGLGTEMLPARPDDPTFELRLKAILRRHVVEHCIYGVDLDPLAVELARLALWIETMDRTLPFTFLDHKLRCGDGLVGTWLDRFRDYPLLAWWRESPDDATKNKSLKLAHHAPNTWLKSLKEYRAKAVDEQADQIRGQRLLARAGFTDDELRSALVRVRQMYAAMREVSPSRPDERGRIWREQVAKDPALQRVREAFDLWTALWFWPLDRLQDAPGPAGLLAPNEAAKKIVGELRSKRRFFHWELEFPDVFVAAGSGFDAIVANPPWEIQKPSSKEFFSNLDPLYRTYGKQEALAKQHVLFEGSSDVERDWLAYTGTFKDAGNFVRNAAEPFGNAEDADGKAAVALIPRRAEGSRELHARWATQRAANAGLADSQHAFRHQGSADLNSYKLFVEQAHALLKPGGQMGLITPSGLYTDKGSLDLRKLLLERCAWRWLYGFENREKVFDIDSRFKFAVTIAQKGGRTEALQAAFMRHALEDWADAKGALRYPAERVKAFSPRSLSVLEIRHERDLEVLTKIYQNSVLLGDEGPDGWGIRYATEFHMTNDSKLFIPRDKAEADGYRADPYGRWIGPGGDVLLPLYEGRMIGQFDFSKKGWVSGKGRAAVWRDIPWERKVVEPQFLMREADFRRLCPRQPHKLLMMNISSATNERTMLAAMVPDYPANHALAALAPRDVASVPALCAGLDSVVFDSALRLRLGGLNVSWFVLEESPLPRPLEAARFLSSASVRLCAVAPVLAPARSRGSERLAMLPAERLRLRCVLDAAVAALTGLQASDLGWILRSCDHPTQRTSEMAFRRTLDPKGFWRIDRDKDPELRHTVLTLVAFDDLQKLIDQRGGDREKGIAAFLALNEGEGWMLPETLRLADYGLGHDDRAKEPQPVASRLGPRFLDWQLAQTPEESWAECERHAKAILGDEAFHRLKDGAPPADVSAARSPLPPALTPYPKARQGTLFDKKP